MPSGSHLRILLVEDNPGDARLIRELLGEAGIVSAGLCHVQRLGDAIAQLGSEPFDIALVDLSLPDSHGLETVDALLAARSDVPMVVLTGNRDESLAVQAVKQGAQDYLLKGQVTGDLLAHAIRYAIERQHMLASLRESEERFQLAMRGANDGLWDLNLQTGQVYYSPRWKGMLGYGEEELEATLEEWGQRIHPDEREATLAELNAHLENRTPHFDNVHRLRHKDGHYLWVESRGKVVTDTTGRPIRAVGTLVDITERKSAEEAVRRANRALTTLSQCNEALVRSVEEQELLSNICRLLINTGGYRLAWVCFASAGERMEAVAHAGWEPGYETLLGAQNQAGPAHPMAVAITSGTTQVIRRLENHSPHGGWQSALVQYGCHALTALPLRMGELILGALGVCACDPGAFASQEIGLMEELAGDLAYGVQTLRTRLERDQAHQALRAVLFQTIQAVALTVEKRDPYTAGHQQRVAELAAAIATDLRLDPERIEGIRLGGLVHDIGKIQVPAEILTNPGRLTDVEVGLIRCHPQVGYEIMSGVQFPWPIKEMILQHHERLDGSGYPAGLKGDQIVLEARILAVADVVEAITSHRPYRASLGHEVAMEEIASGRGTIYDAEAVDSCLRLFGEKGFRWKAA